MSTQPEALRLAVECDTGYPLEEDAKKAAAELRRLHGLNQALMLAEALESDDSSVSCMEAAAAELRRLHEENERLKSARADECEACAKLCEQAAANYFPAMKEAAVGASHCATVIRARALDL